jgi:hypothetical protein
VTAIEDLTGFTADFDKIAASIAFTDGSTAAAATATATTTATTGKAPAETTSPTPPTPAAPEAGVFESAERGLRLRYPTGGGWVARKAPDASTLVFLVAPGTVRAQPRTLAVSIDKPEPGVLRRTLKQQGDTVLAGIQSSVPDAAVIDAEDLKVAGERARRLVIGGHHGTDKVELRAMVLLLALRGGETITLDVRGPAADEAALREAFDGVVGRSR